MVQRSVLTPKPPPTTPANPSKPAVASITLSRAAERVGSSAIRDLLRLTERPDVISFAGGLPDPATFPHDEIAAATTRILARDPGTALQYSTTEGYEPLRAWIAGERGAAPADVLVTHGSQQALDLVARAVLEPGDGVAIADPAYVGALQLLRLAQADLVAIPSDDDGILVDDLADRLRAGWRPRLVYVVSNFHNPTGVTLAAERRVALAALAEHYGFLVVDDDPYGALRWSGTAPRPLAELTGRVVTLGSFSKVLCPGLRIGYAVAPAELAPDLTIIKQAADLHTSTLSQRVVHDLVSRPDFLPAHVEGIRANYARRSARLASVLRARFGDRLELRDADGGMFLWARTTDPALDTSTAMAAAIDHGVAYVPGAAFAADPRRPQTSHLRLSFAGASDDELEEGARRLAAAFGVSTMP